ncbi:hypothetical protein Val02_21690 [Virgisporangium aliadipatigenens]|uniref:Flavin reductase like domain-containing protein n=1 Tax=Virgisporangium aliadipatigenens TaxID=741659 RepID=A0A8J4DQ30_9ACTN|nr:flavin reductase family protein [Virgisporangium aliadipatigenens]GIJ45283.1 hypothetical protein Val02_21690 [Virgisporangium aliadipatigenens]
MNGVTGAEYRALMSAFPTGVAVVTALDAAGQPHGMTCTSLSSVTVDPPTLLVCLDVRSGTLAAIRAGGWFAVNLLHEDARDVAELFAAPVPDRFRRTASRPSPTAGVPWLTGAAMAVAECRVSRRIGAGDHDVVFGEVVTTAHTGDPPLLYGHRRFCAWPGGGSAPAAALATEPGR